MKLNAILNKKNYKYKYQKQIFLKKGKRNYNN